MAILEAPRSKIILHNMATLLELSESNPSRLGDLDCKPGLDDLDTTGATTWSSGTRPLRCRDMHDLTRAGAASRSHPWFGRVRVTRRDLTCFHNSLFIGG